MTMKIIRLSASAGVAVMLAFVAATAFAQGSPAETQERYRRERAACLKGGSNQALETCLREARAAQGEARRNGLSSPAQPALETNQQARCAPLPPADRDDCLRRMRGEGTVSGSVREGGILRELVTVVPAK